MGVVQKIQDQETVRKGDLMKKETKTQKELLAEIADLRRRLEVLEGLSQKSNNIRIGREHAEEALKKAENGQKKAENALKESESQVTNLTSQLLLAEEKERGLPVNSTMASDNL